MGGDAGPIAALVLAATDDVDMADSSTEGGSEDHFEEGEIPLEPEQAWWEVRRQWAEAVDEAGPIPAAIEPRLRVLQETDHGNANLTSEVDRRPLLSQSSAGSWVEVGCLPSLKYFSQPKQ